MMGGLDVATTEQAARLARILLRPVELGEHVEEPPCVPDGWLARIEATQGRPCPRVELEPDNAEAAAAVMLSLGTHTAWLAGPTLEAAGFDDDELAAVLGRVGAALLSPAVVERLYPKKGA